MLTFFDYDLLISKVITRIPASLPSFTNSHTNSNSATAFEIFYLTDQLSNVPWSIKRCKELTVSASDKLYSSQENYVIKSFS